MSSGRFDTLATARDLEATGIERGQAEAIAQAIGSDGEQLATRDDIERLEARTASKEDVQRFEVTTRDNFARLEAQSATKSDIERLEAQSATKNDLERLRAELYRALWIQGGGIVAILAALKFLP